jgi:hypothetical protein
MFSFSSLVAGLAPSDAFVPVSPVSGVDSVGSKSHSERSDETADPSIDEFDEPVPETQRSPQRFES